MRRSILWPPTVSGGRLVMTPDPQDPEADSDGALRQIVMLSLLDYKSTNPWNDGLGLADPTFTPNTAGEHARLRAAISTRFSRLERERRARLVGCEIRVSPDARSVLLVDLTYDNLETGGRRQMDLSVNG